MKLTLNKIAEHVDGKVVSQENIFITGVTSIDTPENGYITFLTNPEVLEKLEQSEIAAIIVPETIINSTKPIIIVKNPKLAFAKIMQLFFPKKTFKKNISEKASISPTAIIAEDVTIEDFAVIKENVQIGRGSTIRSFTYIDNDVSIGENSLIHPNVTIYDHTIIGNNVSIHSSTVIGSDGFGYVADENNKQVKLPQTGNVIIEDDVEIGSNVSVDRAAFGSTLIKAGVKIDNLVQIAHNITIGENTVISGHAGIAGSTTIGKNCVIAAACGIADHCIIEDNVIVGGQSGVASKKRLRTGQVYIGSPARPIKKFVQTQAIMAKLPYLMKQLSEFKSNFSK